MDRLPSQSTTSAGAPPDDVSGTAGAMHENMSESVVKVLREMRYSGQSAPKSRECRLMLSHGAVSHGMISALYTADSICSCQASVLSLSVTVDHWLQCFLMFYVKYCGLWLRNVCVLHISIIRYDNKP